SRGGRHRRYKCDRSSDVCSSDLKLNKMQKKNVECGLYPSFPHSLSLSLSLSFTHTHTHTHTVTHTHTHTRLYAFTHILTHTDTHSRNTETVFQEELRERSGDGEHSGVQRALSHSHG